MLALHTRTHRQTNMHTQTNKHTQTYTNTHTFAYLLPIAPIIVRQSRMLLRDQLMQPHCVAVLEVHNATPSCVLIVTQTLERAIRKEFLFNKKRG